MIGSDALTTEYFSRSPGRGYGRDIVSYADPRTNEEAAAIVEKFRANGYEPEGLTLYSYGGLRSGRRRSKKPARSKPKRSPRRCARRFDTILGMIGFDDKGDVYGYEPFVWYVWQEDNYAPVDPVKE